MTTKINSKVAEARKRLKLSQKELAEATGLSQQLINHIERGNPTSIESALLVADRLYTTVEELFGEQDFPQKSEIAVALMITKSLNKSVEEIYGGIFLN